MASVLSDEELEQHIADCERQYLSAYARFQEHGCPHDRDAALMHLHRMSEAILARSAAVQAARHAAFEQRITEDVAFFMSDAAVAMGRGGCR